MTNKNILSWLLTIISGALVAAVPFVILSKLFVGEENWVLVGDSPQLYFPDWILLKNAIAEGVLPLWDPWERLGDPFFTDPQSGIFYPVNYLFLAIDAVTSFDDYKLYEFKTVWHLSLGAVGLFAFARSGLGLPRLAAMSGAAIFATGPFVVSHLVHCLLWPYAYAPWLLLFLYKLAASEALSSRMGWTVATSLTVGLVITAQSPPAAYYVLVTASFYGAFLLFSLARREFWKKRRSLGPGVVDAAAAGRSRRFLFWGVSALLLGFALGAVIAVPAILHFDHSVLAQRTFRYFSGGAMKIGTIGDLVNATRRLHEEKWVYFGWIPLLGAALAPFLSFRRRGEAIFWCGMAIFFASIVYIDLPTLKLWFTLAPGAELFRIPPRYISITQIAVAIAFAIAVGGLVETMARLLSNIGLRRVSIATMATSIVFGLVGLALAGQVVRDQAPRYGLYRLKKVAKPLFHRDALVPKLERAKLDYRMVNDGYIYVGGGDRFRLRDARGYNTNFVTRRHRRFILNLRPGKQLSLLRLVGAKLYAQHPQNKRAAVWNAHELKRMKKLSASLFEHRGEVMPAAFFLNVVKMVDSPKAAEKNVIKREDYRDYVAVEKGYDVDVKRFLAPKKKRTRKKGRGISPPRFRAGKLKALSHHEAVIEIEAPADGVVVYNALYYPGWVAYVDGVRQEVAPANYLQMVTPIKHGKHKVVFKFETTWLRWPLRVATLGLLINAMLLIAAVVVRRRRKRAQVLLQRSWPPPPVAFGNGAVATDK